MPGKLKIVIPVAGEGTRLRPHTYTTPKPLIPVAGKEMLAHVIDPLLALQPDEFIFVIGYLGDKIEEFIKQKYQFKASFVEQKELRGLGAAVNLGLAKVDNNPVLIILGDTIVRTDLRGLLASEKNTIGLNKVENPDRFGVALVENGRITGFVEKPIKHISDLAIVGLYYIKDTALLKNELSELLSSGKTTGGEIQLTDALDLMIKAGCSFDPFMIDEWFDCGNEETLLATNRAFLADYKNAADIQGSVVISPVFISPDAVIEKSIIGPFVSIHEEVTIKKSIISDSIISPGAKVEYSVMEQSLVGSDTRIIGEGCKLDIGNATEIKKIV
jgi:glucose-1-phosphate thymidylyltransferase